MTLQPISSKRRIHSVDALRGFALLGVLIANIPIAGPDIISSHSDSIINFLSQLLIEKKFITIFSILFGFGFYIQMKRAETKNVRFKRYFMVRMLLLFLIGIIHSYGIWNGDIIMSYAVGGIFLIVVRKLSLKKLILLSIVFNVVLTGMFFIGNSALGWQIYDYDYALDGEYPITPSMVRYLHINFIMNPWSNFFKDMPITLVFTFGNMIIGVILGKVHFFLQGAKAKTLAKRFIWIGMTIGFGSSYVYHLVISGKLELDMTLIWMPFVFFSILIL